MYFLYKTCCLHDPQCNLATSDITGGSLLKDIQLYTTSKHMQQCSQRPINTHFLNVLFFLIGPQISSFYILFTDDWYFYICATRNTLDGLCIITILLQWSLYELISQYSQNLLTSPRPLLGNHTPALSKSQPSNQPEGGRQAPVWYGQSFKYGSLLWPNPFTHSHGTVV